MAAEDVPANGGDRGRPEVWEELDALAFEVRAHLSWLGDAGIDALPRPLSADTGSPSAPKHQAEPHRVAPVRITASPRPAPAVANAPALPQIASWTALREQVDACRQCDLGCHRAGLALGNGVERAELMFIGEKPELSEAGVRLFSEEVQSLLDKMIAAMKFRPEEVACCGAVQCASSQPPPHDCFERCRPWVLAQIALVKPRAIVALGKSAAQTLLQVPTPITRLRGTWNTCQGIPVMPTFHPAYLLKNVEAKRQTWLDLQEVMRALGRG